MADLEISTERTAGTIVISVQGEVDLANSSELQEALVDALDERPSRVVVDLRGVMYLDSTGLGVLLRQHQRALEADVELILVKGPAQVQRVFELTGLAHRLNLVDQPPADA